MERSRQLAHKGGPDLAEAIGAASIDLDIACI
jgi:hypothetical protein